MSEYEHPDLQTQALTAAYTEAFAALGGHNTLEPVYGMQRLTGQEVEIDTHVGIPLTEQEKLGFQSREGDAQIRVIGMLGIPGARRSNPGEADLGVGYVALVSEARSDTTRLALQGLELGRDSQPRVVTAAGATRVYLPPTGTVIIGRNAVSDKGPVVSAAKLWGENATYGVGTSRENTEIRTTPDGMSVRDLGSRKGTFVSPEAVIRQPERTGRPQTIRYAGAVSMRHQ